LKESKLKVESRGKNRDQKSKVEEETERKEKIRTVEDVRDDLLLIKV